jgi:hypothetical protein
LEDGGVLGDVDDEGSYEARSNLLGAIAAASSGLLNTVDSTNPMRGGLPSSANFPLLPDLPVESSSSLIISDREILNWYRHLARSIILIGGPTFTVEVLYIAWSIAVHKNPEARGNLLDILAIIGLTLAIIPTIKKIADNFDER